MSGFGAEANEGGCELTLTLKVAKRKKVWVLASSVNDLIKKKKSFA